MAIQYIGFFAFLYKLWHLFANLIFGKLFLQISMKAGFLGFLVAVWGALSLAFSSVLSVIQYTAPNGWYGIGIALLPSNVAPCISSIVTCVFLRWVLDHKSVFFNVMIR